MLRNIYEQVGTLSIKWDHKLNGIFVKREEYETFNREHKAQVTPFVVIQFNCSLFTNVNEVNKDPQEELEGNTLTCNEYVQVMTRNVNLKTKETPQRKVLMAYKSRQGNNSCRTPSEEVKKLRHLQCMTTSAELLKKRFFSLRKALARKT